jgi:hypothetical protein
MLLVEHKAPHLYLEDAYKEYSWSVDQGAYQPASFIFLSFDGFRNLCPGSRGILQSSCARRMQRSSPHRSSAIHNEYYITINTV